MKNKDLCAQMKNYLKQLQKSLNYFKVKNFN